MSALHYDLSIPNAARKASARRTITKDPSRPSLLGFFVSWPTSRQGWKPRPGSMRGSLSRPVGQRHRSGREAGFSPNVSSRGAKRRTLSESTVPDHNVGQSVETAVTTPQTLASESSNPGSELRFVTPALPRFLMARSNG